jgi:hypothetical protein
MIINKSARFSYSSSKKSKKNICARKKTRAAARLSPEKNKKQSAGDPLPANRVAPRAHLAASRGENSSEAPGILLKVHLCL